MAEATLTVPGFVVTLARGLKKQLKGAAVSYEPIRRDRFRFFVIWDKFDGMGHPERQRLVWDIAESVLERSDLLNVGMILTLGHEDLPREDVPATTNGGRRRRRKL